MTSSPNNAGSPGLPAYLQCLNDAQREAVLSGCSEGRGPPDAPLLVIAGAGSGKTSTLAHRVAHQVACGADPSRILLLTFTTRAAEEMSNRVARILAHLCGADARKPTAAPVSIEWSGTFHSVAARLLREYCGRIGLEATFTIHDREDSSDLMNIMRNELGYSSKGKRFPLKGTCLAIYSTVVNTSRLLAEVLQSAYPWCTEWEAELRGLFLAYVQAKQAQHVLDYDDLLLYWARLVAEPRLGAEIGARFHHIFVDEYQDTNRLQAGILLAMKPDGRGLTVVGDDAQSIYAFRGATVRNILDFPTCFEPPAKQVTLDRNYRSSPQILAAANAVIALAKERYTKNLWTDRPSAARPRLVSVRDDAGQAAYVAERALERREQGVRLKAQAILFRAAHHSARLELELTRRNIPFVKFGGLRFLEAAHVKDVLALMRWARNPRDRVSGFRAIQLIGGMGPKAASRVLNHVMAAPPGCTLLAEQPVPPASEASWPQFVALIDSLARDARAWPAPFERACRWYEAQLERLFEDPRSRSADIQQLARIAATYPSLERFLTELTLEPAEATSDIAGVPLLDEDFLILSTIHSSKGREWTSVTLLNAVDGCIPSDLAAGTEAELEEERRLLYVAMTRARGELDIIVPQRFHVGQPASLADRYVHAIRSRFIPAAILGCFEQSSWPVGTANTDAPAEAAQTVVDLAAQMLEMWR